MSFKSGGAINSPQLLMLSGIGDADHLKEMGIPLVEHVPGVGQNLQDHLELYVVQRCKKPVSLLKYQKGPRMIAVGVQWFLNQTGPTATRSGHNLNRFQFPSSKSLIGLEGKSMTSHMREILSSVPPSNSLVSVSDP